MSITPSQRDLVQQSFALVVPHANHVAAMFYARLFELDPSLRSLFKGDLQEQGRKLTQMLAIAVSLLDKLDSLIPAVQALGKRHIAYGVQKNHYDTVGTALLWTLEQGLGPAFTPDVREAWTTVYGVLVSVATEGLYAEDKQAA